MYLFLMGVLILSLLVNFASHDYENIILIVILIVVTTFTKLLKVFKELEKEHKTLKKRVFVLEEQSEKFAKHESVLHTESSQTHVDNVPSIKVNPNEELNQEPEEALLTSTNAPLDEVQRETDSLKQQRPNLIFSKKPINLIHYAVFVHKE